MMVAELVVVLTAVRLVTVCVVCVCVVCVSVCVCECVIVEYSGNVRAFVHNYWKTMCVMCYADACASFLNCPSDHSTPFRLPVSC